MDHWLAGVSDRAVLPPRTLDTRQAISPQDLPLDVFALEGTWHPGYLYPNP